MGDAPDLDIPPGSISRHDGYFRLPKPALLASFQPHMHNRGKAQCIEAIYPDLRADSARPGPARTETISCVSNYQFGWHITYPYADDVAPLLPAGTIIHVISWHDNTPNNKWNPNPQELGRRRLAVDRRDELRVGDDHLPRGGQTSSSASRRRRPRTEINRPAVSIRATRIAHASRESAALLVSWRQSSRPARRHRRANSAPRPKPLPTEITPIRFNSGQSGRFRISRAGSGIQDGTFDLVFGYFNRN